MSYRKNIQALSQDSLHVMAEKNKYICSSLVIKTQNSYKSGRPRITTNKNERLYQKDPRKMADEITAKMKENYGVNLSISTIK